ncbi:MAG: hypothetical protein F6K21_03000 [Symploca sp. SIO2D2]|nr:hypothetical protein [Symploca sp. SIO2D2]
MPRQSKHNWKAIEETILHNEEPLNYKEIAAKYEVPYDQLRQRASKHKWRSRHEEFLAQVRQERERRQFEDLSDDFYKIDKAVVKITEALLLQVQRILKEAQKSEPMKTQELKQLTDTVAKIREINDFSHGDIAIALKHLVVHNIIPDDIVPQVVDSLRQSEELLKDSLSKAFQGRIPD